LDGWAVGLELEAATVRFQCTSMIPHPKECVSRLLFFFCLGQRRALNILILGGCGRGLGRRGGYVLGSRKTSGHMRSVPIALILTFGLALHHKASPSHPVPDINYFGSKKGACSAGRRGPGVRVGYWSARIFEGWGAGRLLLFVAV